MPFGLPETAASVLVAMVASGVLAIYLGYRIRVRGDVHLMSGTRPEYVTDEEGMTRLAGTASVGVGVLTVLYGLLFPWAPSQAVYWGSYLALAAFAGAYVWVNGKRYTSKAYHS